MHHRYTASADIYDIMYDELFDYEVRVARFVGLIEERSPDALTLLEVACGTGLYLEKLQGRFRVQGLDLSPEMLQVAGARLPDVPLHHADMLKMNLGVQFDVVLCVGSSVAYLPRRADLTKAYERFAAHVAPGGVVIVEPWLTPHAWIEDHVSIDIHERRGIRVVRMTRGERNGNQATMYMHHLVSRPGQRIEHFVENHATGLFQVEEHMAAFAAAGLEAQHFPEDGGLGRGLYVATRA